MSETLQTSTLEPRPTPPAPRRKLPAGQWLRENLFSSPLNTVLTVILFPLVGAVVFQIARFVFVDGRWEILERNLKLILVFRYPADQLWRLWLVLVFLAAVMGLAAGALANIRAEEVADGRANPLGRHVTWRRIAPFALAVVVMLWLARSWTALAYVAVCVAVLAGARYVGQQLLPRAYARWSIIAAFVSPVVAFLILNAPGGQTWDAWGGLLLTVTLATVGIAASFPLGVLLAFGRRSSLPVIRYFCIGYIELIRGVPLVALLFLGGFVIQLFLPPGFGQLNFVSRAVIALVVFTSAYIAEIVRGGIQSVPQGQIEAAQALGLSHLATIRLIVLPQALRAVIPAMVGQFISLFKDTSLVIVLGLTELLGVSEAITKQRDFAFQGYIMETLVFACFLYWVGSYSMSRESQRLERRLGVGER